MNTRNSKFPFVVSALTAAIMVSACGGDGSLGGGDTAGIGGSGFISSGTVTGFGSVFVNGVEFETNSAIFDIEDDLNKTQADLRVGMVVQVEGTINSDGTTGTATGIQYSDDIEGPVSSIVENVDATEKTLDVLGKTVIVSRADTAFEGSNFTYDSIALNNVIEVSGFIDQNGALRASYIELKSISFNAASIFEIKGFITNLSGTSFVVQGINVDASGANISDLPTGLQSNVLVEVKGRYNSTTNTITASEIDAENNDLSDDADEVELEGLITRYVDNSDFDINGIPIDTVTASAVFTPAAPVLQLGDKVEVEGTISNGVLIAMEVEVRGGNAEASAVVDSINLTNNSFTMDIFNGNLIIVQLTTATRMEDNAGSDDHLLLSELQINDFVDVRGFESGVSTITATQVKRESEVKEVELQGLVETPVPTNSVTVLGVTFLVDGATDYENASDVSINQAAFISAATTGTVVSIKDKKSGEGNPLGTADEVEIED
jgi:Domain of unknown function (DUF5666)